MMTGKEKLYFLLDAIDDARAIAPSGQPLLIDPTNDLNLKIRGVELDQLFTKLEKDEKVLKVLKVANRIKTIDIVEDLDPYEDADDGCYHIELLPAFDKYYLKIQNEPQYQKFTGKKPSNQKVQSKTRPKYERKALEKIWDVLQEVEEKRQLGAKNAPISINRYPYGDGIKNYDKFYETRKSVLQKLLSLGAIINLKEGAEGALDFWSFNIGPKYQEVFNEHEQRYKEAANHYEKRKEKEKIKQAIADKEAKYEITYTKTREVLFNNALLLSKPDFDSENDRVFGFLYKHPNQKFTRKQIEEEATKEKLTKSLHKIVENLGFKRDFKKVFFNVSKTAIEFRNPVTQRGLEKMGLNRIRLP